MKDYPPLNNSVLAFRIQKREKSNKKSKRSKMKLTTIYFGALVVEGYDDTRIQDLEDDKLENWDSLNSMKKLCWVLYYSLIIFVSI